MVGAEPDLGSGTPDPPRGGGREGGGGGEAEKLGEGLEERELGRGEAVGNIY